MPPLTIRDLNRATLARQLLLDRAELPVETAVSRLAGMQAQDSTGPYFGLFARLRGFDRDALTDAIGARRLLVATLFRVTIHLVTAEDHRWLKATLAPLFERTRRRAEIAALDHERILDEVRRRLPARMPDLHRLVPSGVNPGAFADFVQSSLPLVRVPPAGTWRVGGTPLQELADVGAADPERLVLSYLRAFGPATVRDAQTWSGLSRLAPVFGRLPLIQLEGEDGAAYYDVPDGPRPPASTPAPVRFLPRYDNLLLAHADRSRFIPPGRPTAGVVGENTVLLDGVVSGTWRWRDGDIEVTPWRPLPRAVEAERRALKAWLADA